MTDARATSCTTRTGRWPCSRSWLRGCTRRPSRAVAWRGSRGLPSWQELWRCGRTRQQDETLPQGHEPLRPGLAPRRAGRTRDRRPAAVSDPVRTSAVGADRLLPRGGVLHLSRLARASRRHRYVVRAQPGCLLRRRAPDRRRPRRLLPGRRLGAGRARVPARARAGRLLDVPGLARRASLLDLGDFTDLSASVTKVVLPASILHSLASGVSLSCAAGSVRPPVGHVLGAVRARKPR